jgi:ankyrin repeat protein
MLLEKGANPNISDKYGDTPLSEAVSNGHHSIVEFLLEKGANPNISNNDGDIPLHEAVNNGHHKIVELLLEKGADPNASNKDGERPLHHASYLGHFDIIRTLVERGADLDVQDSDGDTPIQLASLSGHHEAVRFLLGRGANPSIGDNEWRTPLHSAAEEGSIELVKVLVERGEDLDVQDSDGDTPIHLASLSNHYETVRFLLGKGANPNLGDKEGRTPLHSVAAEGHIQLLKLLIHWGVDIEATESDGQFLLHATASWNLYEATKLLPEKDVNVNVNVLDCDGWTPLFYAAFSGHLDIVKLLLNLGADETIYDTDGETALDTAISNEHLDIAKYLLKVSLAKELPFSALGRCVGNIANHLAFKGLTDLLHLVYGKYYANRNDGDLNGRTALHMSAMSGNIDTFGYLLGIGLDPGAKDAGGNDLLSYASLGGSIDIAKAVQRSGVVPVSQSDCWSPLHWACKVGKLDVVEYLMSQGIKSSIVTISQPQGSWDPASIAIYHGHEKMLESLSPALKSQLYLSLGSDVEDSLRKVGTLHGDFSCDGCEQVSMCRSIKVKYTHAEQDIYGPRWKCNNCGDWDYCFMCYPFLSHVHVNHMWNYIDPEESDDSEESGESEGSNESKESDESDESDKSEESDS